MKGKGERFTKYRIERMALMQSCMENMIVRHNNEVDAKETKQFYENSQFSESRKFVSIKTEVSEGLQDWKVLF